MPSNKSTCSIPTAPKLRELKTDNNLLLNTNFHTGHAGSSGRYDFLNQIAFEDTFLIDRLLGDSPTLELPSLGTPEAFNNRLCGRIRG